jgi:acetylornithine aminotransferase
VRGLEPLVGLEPLDVELDGLVFREVVSAVRVSGGIAANVVPAEAHVELNFRYAPGRSREEAEARLRELVPGGELEVLSNSPSAPPALTNPLAEALRTLVPDVAPKQAWTPVAQFAEQGIDAINYGPGAMAYAHRWITDPGCEPRAPLRDSARLLDSVPPMTIRIAPRSPRWRPPFVRLEDARRLVAGRRRHRLRQGRSVEPTDLTIRAALIDAVPSARPIRSPRACRSPRGAARWCTRAPWRSIQRGAVCNLRRRSDLPGAGAVDRDSRRTHASASRPTPSTARAFAGARVRPLPLLRENGFLPELDSLDDDVSIVWVNYPHNPTGAVAPLAFYEKLTDLAERHDFVIASDEAYTELWFDEPPLSALQASDRSRVIVFQTLSKRSSMTGYRSGFVAAPPEVIAALKAYRPNAGTAPQEFVQRASVVAWNDERHVEETRARYAAKRDTLMPAIAAKGWEIVASEATMYLWVAVPDPDAVVEALLNRGVLVSPGSFFGPSGEGYIRFALVPTLDECERAAAILAEL